jgi:hypothetical protein
MREKTAEELLVLAEIKAKLYTALLMAKLRRG